MQQLGAAVDSNATKNLKSKITTIETLMQTKFVALPTPVHPADVAAQLQAANADLQGYADAVLVIATPTPTVSVQPTQGPTPNTTVIPLP
jgi:hypothetical protein